MWKSTRPSSAEPDAAPRAEGFEINFFGRDDGVKGITVVALDGEIPTDLGAEFTCRVVAVKRETVERE